MLLRFGCLIGCEGPDAFINSKNLPSALIQPDVIDQNIASNLALGRIIEIDAPTNHFISSPLGLVMYQSTMEASEKSIIYHTPTALQSTIILPPKHLPSLIHHSKMSFNKL